MTHEAFVYCWTNLNNGNKYVGYHKGSQSDGYVCSSQSDRFWNDWEQHEWSRQIIAEGTAVECLKLEMAILRAVDIKSDEFYNNGIAGVIYTDEVRAKMSAAGLGRAVSDDTKQLMSEYHTNRPRAHQAKLDEARFGRKFDDKTRAKISAATKTIVTCPYCGLEGGRVGMKRWHFERCKHK